MSVRLTPTSMRQRHSGSGCSGNEDDLEDDASSMREIPTRDSDSRWISGKMEILFWVCCSAFIVCFGDGTKDFVSTLLWDDRIDRVPLNLGIVFMVLKLVIALYVAHFQESASDEQHDSSSASPAALQAVVLLGVLSFVFFTVALWPIWGALGIPLLLTLLITSIVLCQHTPSYRKFRLQAERLRVD